MPMPSLSGLYSFAGKISSTIWNVAANAVDITNKVGVINLRFIKKYMMGVRIR